MTALIDGFTIKADDIEVFCGLGGVSWGYHCYHNACKGIIWGGWDDAPTVAAGATEHLIWHADGMKVWDR